MSQYETILVAVDGSNESDKAFQKAMETAANNKAKLIIAHVIDSRAYTTIQQYDRSFLEQAEKHGESLLADYKEKATKYGVEDVKTVMDYGSPRARLPKNIAVEYKVDLIIAGATGLNAVERMMIGSVSESIARKAPCDVLIVRN
ncbi:universal stress protein [Alteribacillus iranensis]|uniref:Universal stress protein n=1 Tax=Alteribacillus iranensis TaxID=930128 RepID=A0A1I2EY95_9BACI|nr:universal stress protein [Alteribacillus iranensis]SFE97835.1 Nucleotide-binding universal stress protein, UspA family [Alteribacillus iranensis]